MRLTLRFPIGLSLAAVSTVLACSSDAATDPNAPMDLAITLTPSQVVLLLTDTITPSNSTQLSLTATSLGFPVVTPHAEWTTSAPSVALVDASGRVQAIGLGVATITARVNSEKATTVVTVAKQVATATLTPSAFQGLVGDTAILTATAVDSRGAAVGGTAFVFTSLDPTAVSVTRTGNQTAKITLLKPGAAGVSVLAGGQTAATSVTSFTRDFVGSVATSAPAGALVLSAGEDATCGIIPLGRGYCFGLESLLGVAKDTSCFGGGSTNSCTLIPLRIAGDLNLSAISVGDSVACGVASNNFAYCWGSQTYGQLGNGIASTGTSAAPSLVSGAVSRSAVLLARVTAGRNHACGLTVAGNALCWGKDDLYQLGNGDGLALNSTTPIPVNTAQTFTRISAGGDHTCGLTGGGSVVCWGDNSQGQIGNGVVGGAVDTPAPVAGNFAQISAGASHTCALTASGAAFCWGSNDSGQVGNGTQVGSATPVAVSGGLSFKAISASRYGTCGITTAGTAFCWGSNQWGQTGTGSAGGTPQLVPAAVVGSHTDFVAIAAGVRHVCALATTGAFCWGSNVFGALGNELQALVQPSPTRTAAPQ
jgi:alpha-tubulin suppressor-like RCC1 family protein